MSAAESVIAVKDAFGIHGLLRPTAEVLAQLLLPPDSTKFLLNGGLPRCRVFGFDFRPVQVLPPANEYGAAHGYPLLDNEFAAARCIGDSWGVLMVLEMITCNVLWIDPRGEHKKMFVNTNVESLGACCAAYASLEPLRQSLGPKQLSVELDKMLSGIDARCAEGWWSTVIQEVEFGLS